MGYQVTITADTIVELGGKLLALAAQFQTDPIMPEVKASPKKTAPAKSEPAEQAADAKPAEETRHETIEAPAVTDDTLRDLVIGLVKAKGREVMPPLLAQFGVAKATEVTDPAIRIELANALRDAAA